MNNVHMLVGIPGSGKTTFSKKLAEEINAVVVSTDRIRKENPGINEDDVFPEVYRLCGYYLMLGYDVILDATNIDKGVRKTNLDGIRGYFSHFNTIVYYFNVPLDICISRVDKRNKNKEELYLPLEVCNLYQNKIEMPDDSEGFIEVIEIN